VDVGDIAQIVAFVLPGYLAAQVSDLVVRTKKRDDFERLAVSLFFSLVAYVLVCGAVWFWHRDDWFLRRDICVENWPFVAAVLLVAVLIGGMWGSVGRSRRLTEKLREFGIFYSHYPNVWNSLWESQYQALVIARLDDGTEFRGVLRRFSNDPNQELQELWLRPVYVCDETGEYREEEGLSVYIPANRLVSLSAYRDEDVKAEDSSATSDSTNTTSS